MKKTSLRSKEVFNLKALAEPVEANLFQLDINWGICFH
jgi:hypothetical protein